MVRAADDLERRWAKARAAAEASYSPRGPLRDNPGWAWCLLVAGAIVGATLVMVRPSGASASRQYVGWMLVVGSFTALVRAAWLMRRAANVGMKVLQGLTRAQCKLVRLQARGRVPVSSFDTDLVGAVAKHMSKPARQIVYWLGIGGMGWGIGMATSAAPAHLPLSQRAIVYGVFAAGFIVWSAITIRHAREAQAYLDSVEQTVGLSSISK